MKMKSRAAVLSAPRKIGIREFPVPEIKDNDALLEVEMCGVCGSDPPMYRGESENAWPLILGHEFVGRIAEIGEYKSRISGCKKGDRVVVETRFGCGVCPECIKGRYNRCVDSLGYGYKVPCTKPPFLWGAYSEYVYLPERAILHKIREDVPAEAACLTCAVLGNSVRWLAQIGGATLGQTIVILGPGQQGLGGVVVAKEVGASNIIITGRSEERLQMAKRLGATHTVDTRQTDPVEYIREVTDGQMADIVFDCSGSVEAMSSSVDMVKKGATIVTPGVYHGKSALIDFDKVVFGEITIKGAHTHDMGSVEPAIRIIESGRYPLHEMVTHVYSLDEAEHALKVAGREIEGEDPVKVAIAPNS